MELRPEEIANAINLTADSVIQLHSAGLLEQAIINKANILIIKLLNSIEKGMEETSCPCKDCDCNQLPKQDIKMGFIEKAWQDLGAMLSMKENFCENLILIQSMDLAKLKAATKEIVSIQKMNAVTGVVDEMEVVREMQNLAMSAIKDESAFYLEYVIQIISQMMGQSPEDCK
tara:strand:+ start:50 stop:568 length:519 start_codon:yes stop_codon:yes gene_type:complete